MRNIIYFITLLTISVNAKADLIDFTGGTAIRNDGTSYTTNNTAHDFEGIDYYTQNGYKFDFIEDSYKDPFNTSVGNYFNNGTDVFHGHAPGLREIKVSAVNGSNFTANSFRLTTHAGESWAVNAVAADGTILGTQALPQEQWGAGITQGTNPIITLGNDFNNVKEITFTANNGAFGLGFDDFNFVQKYLVSEDVSKLDKNLEIIRQARDEKETILSKIKNGEFGDDSIVGKFYTDTNHILNHPVVSGLAIFEGQIIASRDIILQALHFESTSKDYLKALDAISDLKQKVNVSKVLGNIDNLDEIEDTLKLAIKNKESLSNISTTSFSRLTNNLKTFTSKTSSFISNALLVYESGLLVNKVINGEEIKRSDIEDYAQVSTIALLASNSITNVATKTMTTGVAGMLGLAKLTVGVAELFAGSMSDSIELSVTSVEKSIKRLVESTRDMNGLAINANVSRLDAEKYASTVITEKSRVINEIIDKLEFWSGETRNIGQVFADNLVVAITGNIFKRQEAADKLLNYIEILNKVDITTENLMATFDISRENSILTQNWSNYPFSSEVIVKTKINQFPTPIFTIDFSTGDALSGEGSLLNDSFSVNGTAFFENNLLVLQTHSPTLVFLDLLIPSDAVSLSFDFLATNTVVDDLLTFMIDDELIFSITGDMFGSEWIQTGLLDILKYAGLDVTLTIGLLSPQGIESEIFIDNLQFYDTLSTQGAASSVPEPSSLALLFLALTALLLVHNKRNDRICLKKSLKGGIFKC